MAMHGRAGVVQSGEAWKGTAQHGRHGWAMIGAARYCTAGEDGRGDARRGLAGGVKRGEERQGWAGLVGSVEDMQGNVRSCPVRQARKQQRKEKDGIKDHSRTEENRGKTRW